MKNTIYLGNGCLEATYEKGNLSFLNQEIITTQRVGIIEYKILTEQKGVETPTKQVEKDTYVSTLNVKIKRNEPLLIRANAQDQVDVYIEFRLNKDEIVSAKTIAEEYFTTSEFQGVINGEPVSSKEELDEFINKTIDSYNSGITVIIPGDSLLTYPNMDEDWVINKNHHSTLMVIRNFLSYMKDEKFIINKLFYGTIMYPEMYIHPKLQRDFFYFLQRAQKTIGINVTLYTLSVLIIQVIDKNVILKVESTTSTSILKNKEKWKSKNQKLNVSVIDTTISMKSIRL